MNNDLLLNLLSEFIGILFTVLIIDQLARQREKKRWAVAEKICLAELCDTIGDFLDKIIPDEEKRITFAQFKYGIYSGEPCIDADTELLKFLEQRIVISTNFLAVVSLRYMHIDLQKLRRDYHHLLDPEIVSYILQIESETEWNVKKDIREDKIPNKDASFLFPTRSLISAVKIMQWLEKKADKKITLSEYEKMKEENAWLFRPKDKE